MNILPFLRQLLIGAAFLLSPLAALADTAPDAKTQIEQLLMSTWDTPTNPLIVTPIINAEHYALAGWTQQEHGGVALLKQRSDGQWRVALCGNDSVSDAEYLVQAGLPATVADQLATSFNQHSQQLPEAHRAKFTTFGDTLFLGEDDTHHHP